MQVAVYPVLPGPSCLQHLEVAVLLRQALEALGEKRSLCEIRVEIASYHPVVLLLGGIAVKHLYLHAGQVVRHDISRHEHGLRLEIIDGLHVVGPCHLSVEWKLADALSVYIPQHLIAALPDCLVVDGLQDVDGILILTEQYDSHFLWCINRCKDSIKLRNMQIYLENRFFCLTFAV